MVELIIDFDQQLINNNFVVVLKKHTRDYGKKRKLNATLTLNVR